MNTKNIGQSYAINSALYAVTIRNFVVMFVSSLQNKMGHLKKLTVSGAVLTLLSAVAIGVGWHFLSLPTVPPTLPVQYWGPEEAKPDNPAVISFKINISNDIIEDLYYRLEHLPPLTPPLEGANFQYGFNTDYLQKVVQFWLKEYKWKEREAFLNKLPHFRTQVSGLDIHFIHVKPFKVPEGVKVFPLLMMHGWPSSVRDFYEIVPLLTNPRAQEKFLFEVVIPSLPGHGFSDGASKQGLGAAQIAVVMKSLMDRLGFKKFYIQGGDWGAIIASHVGVLFPDNVLGIHSNMCFSNSPLTILKEMISHLWPSLFYNENEIPHLRSFGERLPFILEETGYMHLQATKPDTIGTALSDSPAGLAAYILEKFSTWTNPDWRSLPDGGLTQKYTLTNLLDNIMIYWVTDTITSSLRLYSETFSRAQFSLDLDRVQCLVPTACAVFPSTLRIQYQPEFLLRDKFPNLVQVSNIPRGGHFPAFEEPGLLSDDIWSAVDKMMKHSNHYMPK